MAARLPATCARELTQELLAHVPGCENGLAPVAICPLQGGGRNSVWRVDTHLGRFVLRIHGDNGEQLGAHRAREALLQTVAARAGLAPALIHADPQGRFIVMEYLSAPVWQASDLEQPARLQELGAWYAKLHALAAPDVAPFDPLALLCSHASLLTAAQPARTVELKAVVAQATIAARACHSSTRPPAIIHGDPHYTNFIGVQPLHLIDWEYAAVTDPLFDLACLLAYYPSLSPYAALLFDSAGLARQASLHELNAAVALYTTLNALWYEVAGLGTGAMLARPAD